MLAGQINDLLEIIAAMNAMLGRGRLPLPHIKIYIVQLMQLIQVMPLGIILMSTTKARRVQILHHGNLRTSPSGSTTPSWSYTIFSPTPTSMGYLTILHFKSMIRRTTIGMKTLCLETGAGNWQYVIFTNYFILLTSDLFIGYDCEGQVHSWINTCSCHPWQ